MFFFSCSLRRGRSLDILDSLSSSASVGFDSTGDSSISLIAALGTRLWRFWDGPADALVVDAGGGGLLLEESESLGRLLGDVTVAFCSGDKAVFKERGRGGVLFKDTAFEVDVGGVWPSSLGDDDAPED